jgi:hypothetical protein
MGGLALYILDVPAAKQAYALGDSSSVLGVRVCKE